MAELASLYMEIHRFAADRDQGKPPLVSRRAVARSLDSDLMLLAQGLAQGTQRVTGYPYRSPSGLSPTGRRLDALLEPLGHTIDHTDEGRSYAYSTDLVPWYPGKNRRGRDNRPSSDDVAICWRWFERECTLVEPRAVILLGGWASDHFLRRYAVERPAMGRLEDMAGKIFAVTVSRNPFIATPAFHPAAIWGRFEAPGRESWRRAAAALTSRGVIPRRPTTE